MLKFSIIIPVYNVEAYIKSCLESCSNQNGMTEEEYEIIVVDDQTPDRSMEIVAEFQEKHRNIKILTRPNGGLSAARNTGLEAARGEYVWFVDSDDSIADNALEQMSLWTSDGEFEIGVFEAVYLYQNEKKRRASECFHSPCHGSLDDFLKSLESNMTAWTHLYRRSFLEHSRLKFQEGIWYEDIEFNMRAYSTARDFAYLPEYLYFYKADRAGSIMSQKSDIRASNSYLALLNTSQSLERHWGADPVKKRWFAARSMDAVRHTIYSSWKLNTKAEAAVMNHLKKKRTAILRSGWNSCVFSCFLWAFFTFLTPSLFSTLLRRKNNIRSIET